MHSYAKRQAESGIMQLEQKEDHAKHKISHLNQIIYLISAFFKIMCASCTRDISNLVAGHFWPITAFRKSALPAHRLFLYKRCCLMMPGSLAPKLWNPENILAGGPPWQNMPGLKIYCSLLLLQYSRALTFFWLEEYQQLIENKGSQYKTINTNPFKKWRFILFIIVKLMELQKDQISWWCPHWCF